jgi:hypothetical protein
MLRKPDEMKTRGLPLDLMLRDAQALWPSDAACHVMALVAEVRNLSEALAVACRHLDAYGTVTGGHEAEMASQVGAFAAMSPYVEPCGHKWVSIYRTA